VLALGTELIHGLSPQVQVPDVEHRHARLGRNRSTLDLDADRAEVVAQPDREQRRVALGRLLRARDEAERAFIAEDVRAGDAADLDVGAGNARGGRES
jgi:hypothetical protein